ncbi:MAG TPA: sterol desaturase family protein [Steroidobacteraceae bacterium]|jgi:sterol desaturase/sphingolipid hydroxylase (fatty acid hydroxylase superfamily)|nr:sterol desaturase family protein [Steroidobacteraceae bacterium]
MRLSRLSYYSDFVVYPLVLAALAAIDFNRGPRASGIEWIAAAAAGLLLWTLMEYALHRVALHRMAYFSPMHGLHHASPLDLIGTPTWVSVSVLCAGILIPAWACLGFNVADGLTIGVMLGYWWYGIVHHVIHHHASSPSSSYFNELRAWHMRHHYSPKRGNFGVTTGLWDHVFGTAIAARKGGVELRKSAPI